MVYSLLLLQSKFHVLLQLLHGNNYDAIIAHVILADAHTCMHAYLLVVTKYQICMKYHLSSLYYWLLDTTIQIRCRPHTGQHEPLYRAHAVLSGVFT